MAHTKDLGCRLRGLVRIAAVLCLIAYGLSSWADPALPTLLSDHMVVQQGREIHIWGKADPDEKLSVSLAGHTATTTADSSHRWSVHFPALSAGGPSPSRFRETSKS